MSRARKPFGAIFGKYKHYDPKTEGPGNPEDWAGAFQERMGLKEAKETLKGRGPRGVLGVSATATWEEIKKAFRALVLAKHPDRVPEADKARAHVEIKDIIAAYSVLADEFGM